MMATTAAVVTGESAADAKIVKRTVFGLSFPVMWLSDDESHLRCYKIWRNPVIQNVNKVWNLPESGVFLYGQRIIFPCITTSFFIYVPIGKEHVPLTGAQEIKLEGEEHPEIFETPQEEAIRVLVLCHERLIFN
jgi:hypothetical protein